MRPSEKERRELIGMIRRLRNLKRPTESDITLIKDLENKLDNLTKIKNKKSPKKEHINEQNVPY